MYDVITDTWHSCSPLLVPRRLHGATVLNQSIYVFGGNTVIQMMEYGILLQSSDLICLVIVGQD